MGSQTLDASTIMSTRTFVTGMVRRDGTLLASEVYDVGAALGFTTHQVRLCFARVVTDGLFTQDGRGRKAVLRATTRHELVHGSDPLYLRFAYDQDAGLVEWDGQWRLVAFTIEEERRGARSALRDVLVNLGSALVSGGLYAHANDIDEAIHHAAAELDVVNNVTLAHVGRLEVGGESRPAAVAARLWPLDDIAESYRMFISTFGPVLESRRRRDAVSELATGVAMSTAFEQCILTDPLLPAELLPARWPGVRARHLVRVGAARLLDARREVGAPALFARYDEMFADGIAESKAGLAGRASASRPDAFAGCGGAAGRRRRSGRSEA